MLKIGVLGAGHLGNICVYYNNLTNMNWLVYDPNQENAEKDIKRIWIQTF
jgi:phosphoglycerate dehydrogenase-like enzyme